MSAVSLLMMPLLWLAVTVGVFELCDIASRRSGRHPLCHPVLWSTPILIGLLLLTDTSYDVFKEATMPISFLLGPAVVGLAVPIWAERKRIKRLAIPIVLSLAAGALISIISAVGILALFGVPEEILASIAPRATTTPVAMAVAGQLGGVPAVAALVVLIAGVLGAMIGSPLMNMLGIKDYQARGFGIGVSSHGVGAARAFQVSPATGAMASLGMGLNAFVTSAILSVLALLS